MKYYTDESQRKLKGHIVIKGYGVAVHRKLDSEELYLSPEESGGKDLVLSFNDSTEKDEWREAFEAHIAAFTKLNMEISTDSFSRIM